MHRKARQTRNNKRKVRKDTKEAKQDTWIKKVKRN